MNIEADAANLKISFFMTVKEVEENLEDPVTNELMREAVALYPCGHTLNKDTAIQCLAYNRLCPLDRKTIETIIPNYTVRQIVEKQQANEESKKQAESYVGKSKKLAEQGEIKSAIKQLEKALKIWPVYEEARAYLNSYKQLCSIQRLNFLDGSVYEGECYQGKAHGRGKKVFPSGRIYEGKFRNDSLNGQGKITTPNGAIYEGKFKDGFLEGRGKIIFYDQTVYEGEFQKDDLNGQGKITCPDGRVYEGTFQKDELNGQGKITYPDGSIYEGEFQKNELNGQGKITYADGRIYEGEFRKDALNGQGKITYPDGRIYEGEFQNDALNGQGKITYPKSLIFEGEFRNDRLNGQGRVSNFKGKVQCEGIFEDDCCVISHKKGIYKREI